MNQGNLDNKLHQALYEEASLFSLQLAEATLFRKVSNMLVYFRFEDESLCSMSEDSQLLLSYLLEAKDLETAMEAIRGDFNVDASTLKDDLATVLAPLLLKGFFKLKEIS